ncbi:hypothetical protein Bhyg_01549, partial [Pseudolycoriella hygida]
MVSLLKQCCLLLVIFCVTVDARDCELQLPRYAFNAPLIFTQNGTLKTTESNDDNNFVRITDSENIILSCAPNYFDSIESTYLEATCKGNDVLTVNGVEKKFQKDLSCELRVIEEILIPVTGCDS